MSGFIPGSSPVLVDLPLEGFPGDPVAVSVMADRYVTVAEAIRGAASRLRSLDRGSMTSEAVDAFIAKAGTVAAQLSSAEGRYENTGSALRSYSTSLQIAQDGAAPLVRDHEEARSDYAAALKLQGHFRGLALTDHASSEYHYDQVDLQEKRAQEALDWMFSLGSRRNGLAADLESAAQRAIAQIDDATADGLDDSAFDDFQGWMEENDGWITSVLDRLQDAAALISLLAIAFPALNAISVSIMVVILAVQALRWAAGTGSLLETAGAATSILSFGVATSLARGTSAALPSVLSRRAQGLVDMGVSRKSAVAAIDRSWKRSSSKPLSLERLAAMGDDSVAQPLDFIRTGRLASFADDAETIAIIRRRLYLQTFFTGSGLVTDAIGAVQRHKSDLLNFRREEGAFR